ncbi:MAG: metallophosphoesterase [bacterium]|nr:metallophosphoesterase [bacterium]
MKPGQIIIFLSLVLVLYSAINLFIFLRLRQAMSGLGGLKPVLITAWLVWALAYPLGRILEGFSHNGFSKILIVTGSVYLAVMASLFLLFLVSDLIQLILKLIPAASVRSAASSVKWPVVSGIVVTAVVLTSTLAGMWNAAFIRVRKLDLEVPKAVAGVRELRIAALSDTHFGTVLGRRHMEKVASRIREIDPDIILFCGDIFDEDLTEAAEQNVAAAIRALPARRGKFAVLGNHEHFHNPRKAVEYIRSAGVVVLEDSIATVADCIRIIGRKDRQAGIRMTVADLVQTLKPEDVRILLDHQPFHLEEAEKNGIDLQFSGHTHYGQLFPFNYITDRVYELSYGYLRKGNTHVVVSCGVGTWGPPVRTAGRTEVVGIRVRFTG